MYCYKCGTHCKDTATYCKKCNSSLLETVTDSKGVKRVAPEALKKFRLSRKEPRVSDVAAIFPELHLEDDHTPLRRSPRLDELAEALRKKGLKNIEDSFARETAGIDAFYRAKVDRAQGREKTTENEYYQGALADARQRRDLEIAGLGDVKKAKEALINIALVSIQANTPIPPFGNVSSSHAFAQYIHKRRDNSKDHREAGNCLIIVGLIFAIIGFLFFFLSFKVSTDPTILNKVIKFDSFEFIVFVVGCTVGLVMLIVGLVFALTSLRSRLMLNKALTYFSAIFLISQK